MRKYLTKKKRFQVLERDGFKCKYCGKGSDFTVLEVDHIVSVKNGGTNELDNLITSCYDCNRGKGSNNLGESKKDLYKQKLSDACYELQKYFYSEWNRRNMGTITGNEISMLKIYVKDYIFGEVGDDWMTRVDMLDDDMSFEEQCQNFKLGGDFCDKVIIRMVEPEKEYILDVIEEVYEPGNWKWDNEEDYSGKLNYKLTEMLLGNDIYFHKKYSLFPKLFNKYV